MSRNGGRSMRRWQWAVAQPNLSARAGGGSGEEAFRAHRSPSYRSIRRCQCSSCDPALPLSSRCGTGGHPADRDSRDGGCECGEEFDETVTRGSETASANFRAMAGRSPLLSSPFAADSRSLAAFRIALGAIVVWEALWLLPRAGALLSSAGVLPLRALHVGWPAGTQFWSLNAASGGIVLQWALLLLLTSSGVSLALGHRPQASALCCWALYASLTNRNPMMAHGGDSLVRMELLLAAFAPLGECWTLEAPSTTGTARPRLRSTLGVAALMLQPVVMYHFAGALKFGATWRTERSAVYYALHVDMAVKAPAHRLRAQPALCRLASALTPLLEQWIAPLLLLCPLSAWRDRARLIAIGALAGLQLGFFGCMVLGNFPFISTAALLPFYPPAVWDALASATSPIRRLRPIWLRVHRAALAGWRAAGVQAPPAWEGTLGRASRALLVAIGVWVFLWNAASYCVNFKQFGALARPLPPPSP